MNTARSLGRPALPAILLAATACAAAVAPTTASAATSADEMRQATMSIRYDDLNLMTPSGATTMYHRLRSAARATCGNPGWTLAEQADWNRCYRNALDEAVRKVDSPILSALHHGLLPAVTAMRR
ncbi:MAG: UrcA family protein [Proteobacteria bacterium]|nr:UrcA family protein [Pseudomonadota bacterium]